jgi:hypothetical protein
MDTQAVLKAGGAGAVVLVILTLLSFIPCVGCFTWILTLLAYVGIGVLAAYWMAPPRTGGSGAKNGAIAALVAGLIAGLVNMVIQGIYFAITGASQMTQALADLPPEQLQALQELGIDPNTLAGLGGIGAMVGIGAFCCLLGVLIAAALGALGGYFWANSHPS